jgi:hypothetical protein
LGYSVSMNVFLSWSGSKSKAIAEILQKYLPCIINQVKPWMSNHQIDAGAKWSAEIAKNLESSNVGICCITADNQGAPWILFEAGAISKLTTVGLAIVLRIDLKTSDVVGPLSQFHSISLEQEDIWKMITTINKAGPSVSEPTLRLTFDAFWKLINADIEEALSAHATKAPAKRPDNEMIEELLELARRQDVANQLLMSRTELIDLRLEQKEQRDAFGITSAGTLNTIYGQSLNNPFAKPFSALDALSSMSRLNPIYADRVPRREVAAAHQDIENDTDDKNE